ncbi:hypothetical protein E2C01_085344 [Portunus trituberculatus]|uniref:Uncharacterized protein n=1 Tax=Portunus trituberculatus TaxID=210409 RepID=A0A5B7J7C7_PORTR|nr:hypothetical protein [Portunus trituberculatus]
MEWLSLLQEDAHSCPGHSTSCAIFLLLPRPY